MKVLYVGGYGRSGSTLLGALIGSQPKIVYVGELSFLAEDWSRIRPCSCGVPYSKCEFWMGALNGSNAADVARIGRRIEAFSSLWLHASGFSFLRTKEAYRKDQRKLLEYALGRNNDSVVIDGSKSAWATAWRAVALRNLASCEIYMVHLVRDIRATLRSISRFRSNWEAEGKRGSVRLPMLRGTVGWAVANLSACITGLYLGQRRYLRLRYEELLENPVGVMREIATFIGEDLSEPIERLRMGNAVDIGHVVGGSRIRFRESLTLRKGPLG